MSKERSRQMDFRQAVADHAELESFLRDASSSLEYEDLRGADEALKKADVKSANMWGGVGIPALPSHVRELAALHGDLRRYMYGPDGHETDLASLLDRLEDLRSRFKLDSG